MHEQQSLRDMEKFFALEQYTFEDWLVSTALLQVGAYHEDPADRVIEHSDGTCEVTEEGKDFFRWNAFAAIAEIVEMSEEMAWKPWATSHHVNRTQLIGEAVDALHFLGNILRMVRCSGRELTMAYQAKQAKNAQRQREGYDGVTGKCPNCHRDLGEAGLQKYAGFGKASSTLLTFCSESCAVGFDG